MQVLEKIQVSSYQESPESFQPRTSEQEKVRVDMRVMFKQLMMKSKRAKASKLEKGLDCMMSREGGGRKPENGRGDSTYVVEKDEHTVKEVGLITRWVGGRDSL